jgi:hypothetical protein
VFDSQQDLNNGGIETIVFLHSSKDKILANFNEVPGIHIIADPKKIFYRLYGSEFSWKKLFSFSSWKETFSSFFKGYFPQFNRFEGGIIGIPSDFLVDESGKIAYSHYGKHFGDSLTVSEVLAWAKKGS